MKTVVKIIGLDRLIGRWETAPNKIKKLTTASLKKAGYIVEREAKILVSGKMVNVRTGRLRSSISLASSLALRASPYVSISPHVTYAKYLHGGTRYIEARPFMTESYRISKGRIEKEMKGLLKKITKELK